MGGKAIGDDGSPALIWTRALSLVGLAGFVICTAAKMSDIASFIVDWPDF